MKDPYKTLGVTRESTDAEIKKAYYALAKKYHPDNYQGSNVADLAEEKMKEINEAYAAIERERASGGGTAYDYQYDDEQSPSSSSSSSFSSGKYSATYRQIRMLVNERRYDRAISMLTAIPSDARDAEWQYLYGCVLLGMGQYLEAVKYIETACYMQPENLEYARMRDTIRRQTSSYSTPYRNRDDDICRVCQTLWCADCLCECMGGDLIPCC